MASRSLSAERKPARQFESAYTLGRRERQEAGPPNEAVNMSGAQILSLSKPVGLWWLTVLSLAALGFGQRSLTVSPTVGPPTSSVLVSGTGFSAGVDVDIYFDATHLALALTDGNGSFSKSIHVPASAVPGTLDYRQGLDRECPIELRGSNFVGAVSQGHTPALQPVRERA